MLIWHSLSAEKLKMLDRTCRDPSLQTLALVGLLLWTFVNEHSASFSRSRYQLLKHRRAESVRLTVFLAAWFVSNSSVLVLLFGPCCDVCFCILLFN